MEKPKVPLWTKEELAAIKMIHGAQRYISIYDSLEDFERDAVMREMGDLGFISYDVATINRDSAAEFLRARNPYVYLQHASLGDEPVIKPYAELESLAAKCAENANLSGDLGQIDFRFWPVNFTALSEFLEHVEAHIKEAID